MKAAEFGTGNAAHEWRPERFKGPIFDVGMHDGADTAAYLSRGYAVLAIEADPSLASAGADRFEDAIRRGQLHILNVGIGEQEGASTFWICDDNSLWNSFDERVASRNGCRHHPITVAFRRFRDILEEFGIPEYLKVDIEGADWLCVRDLDRRRLPRFISVESECAGDGETLSEQQSLRMLDVLREAGYSRFKLVFQDDFTTAVNPDRWRLARRIIDSAAYGRLEKLRLAPLVRRFSTRGRLERLNGGVPLRCGSTGPWGRGLLGRWSTYEHARHTYLRLRDRFFADTNAKTYAFWYDWHATY
jgi:FkbM family methyltransferase